MSARTDNVHSETLYAETMDAGVIAGLNVLRIINETPEPGFNFGYREYNERLVRNFKARARI